MFEFNYFTQNKNSMKSVFWIFLCLMTLSLGVQAQEEDFSDLETLRLETEEDYRTHEPMALKCAKFLLQAPISDGEEMLQVAHSLKWMNAWMQGTPDYTFEIQYYITQLATKDNMLLLGVYLSAMVEQAIEQKDNAIKIDPQLYAAKKLVAYCKDSKMNVRQTRAVKKLIKMSDKGKLKSYIN